MFYRGAAWLKIKLRSNKYEELYTFWATWTYNYMYTCCRSNVKQPWCGRKADLAESRSWVLDAVKQDAICIMYLYPLNETIEHARIIPLLMSEVKKLGFNSSSDVSHKSWALISVYPIKWRLQFLTDKPHQWTAKCLMMWIKSTLRSSKWKPTEEDVNTKV